MFSITTVAVVHDAKYQDGGLEIIERPLWAELVANHTPFVNRYGWVYSLWCKLLNLAERHETTIVEFPITADARDAITQFWDAE